MRVFWALDPGEEIRDAIDRVAGAVPAGRQVPFENLHLTLAFLGEITAAQAEAFHEAVSGERLMAPELRIEGLDLWGGKRPAVLVARMAMTPGLEQLHRVAGRAARGAGITLERRKFRPHVTLVRFGKGLDGGQAQRLNGALAGFAGFEWPEGRAQTAHLWQSYLRPAGAVHEVMAEYDLGDV